MACLLLVIILLGIDPDKDRGVGSSSDNPPYLPHVS